MRTAEQIIADLKHQIYWSQPNMRFNEMNALVAELEDTLFPSEAAPQPTEEEIAAANEIWSENTSTPLEEIIEELVIEEPVVEEVIEETPTEEVAVKPTKRSKK